MSPHYGQPTLWKFEPFITEWENKFVRGWTERRVVDSAERDEEDEQDSRADDDETLF